MAGSAQIEIGQPVGNAQQAGIVPARGDQLHAYGKAALALQNEGATPPGVDPAHHRVRSAALVLPREDSFVESSAEALKAEPGKPHATD